MPSLRGLACALPFAAVLSLASSARPPFAAAKAAAPVFPISPVVPPDIPGGAPAATLQDAAVFAWQEFIALNWPAKSGLRDTPDPSRPFGSTAGPLVWHTFRAKSEIYPGNGSATVGPHGYEPGSQVKDFGYDDPPRYVYAAAVGDQGLVPACPGQTPVSQPAWINLDEVSQIALDSMFAGVVTAGKTAKNSNPQLIRFMAKANRTEYTYVVGNQYWYKSPGLVKAVTNFQAAVKNRQFPPASPYVRFPAGTLEVKAAFRPLTDPEAKGGRFYTTRVRYYEQNAGAPCYFEDDWGLIALHLMHKTPSAPAFTFATFEQADNLLATVGGKTVPVEDVDGTLVNPSASGPTTPALVYADAPNPPGPKVSLSPGSAPFCDTPGPRLFYQNESTQTAIPTGGNVCVNQRDHAIPPAVVAVNEAAHSAIAAYAAANGVPSQPWAYYKLVNVQAYPFDRTQIDPDPSSPHNASTFFQANVVVETNYTLQNFSGAPPVGGAPTDYVPGTQQRYFQNTYVYGLKGTPAFKAYDMGGCMGCHGVAQAVKGTDFSFILAQSSVRFPETPDQLEGAALRERYRPLLAATPQE